MKKEKIKLYTIQITLILFLLLAMFWGNVFTRQIIAVVLLVFMIISLVLIRTNTIKPLDGKQVTILLGAFGTIYIAIIYILGIFTGFYNSTVKLSVWSILNYIIPYTIIIISSEIMRRTLLLKEDKVTSILITISMVLLDVILWTNIYELKTIKDFFTLIAFIIFSSVANNLLYNYIIMRYKDARPIIIYRMITTLYIYIIPITPDTYIFLESILRIIVPYIIYVIIEGLHSKNNQIISTKQKIKEIIISVILCIIVALIVMLVSCRFRFGALTIGSGSMTGTINKGDIIIYEKYKENENVKTGDIIVFTSDDTRIVHRVTEQRNLGDEIRYYTKGDANEQEDQGYRLRTDVVGKVKFRIPYIGYLTLLINDMFE